MEYTTGLVVACLVILVIYWLSGNKNRKLPPGPTGFPFVGYIPFMSSKPHIDFQNLAKKYGPIFSLKLGSKTVIVLSDYPSTKSAFLQDAFIGRPPESPFEQNQETLDTQAFIGLPWKEQRRFSLHILRDLGFGKSRMEELLREEIQDLLDHFEKFEGKPFLQRPILAPSMSNNIATLMYGNRLKYDDPIRQMLDNGLRESGNAAGQVIWELFFPGLAKVAKVFGFGGAAKLSKILGEQKQYTQGQIEEHEKTLDESNIRDFIDGYLIEIHKRNDKSFSKKVLEDLVGGFFGAGSETVRLAVDWLLLIMAAYPEVQEKIHEEIKTVIGRDRKPYWTDHVNMPYTQSCIMEMLRWRTIIPINILRYTLWDTELNGYFIPKGCFVIANLWDIHHNPEYWGKDAESFRVERFLTGNGNEIKKSEYFIPFSVGKRSCPGENFARIEVFLYFVSILQKFKICVPEGVSLDLEGELGAGLMPKPHDLCLKKRY